MLLCGTMYYRSTYSVRARAIWGRHVKNYSIVRIGDEYIVQADEKSILKVASRRRAARLITDAAELLSSQPLPHLPPQAAAEPSIERDRSEVS
jgi:hypothetical protein